MADHDMLSMNFDEWKQAFSAEMQRRANFPKYLSDDMAEQAAESFKDGMSPADAVEEELYAMAGNHDPDEAPE